MNDARVEKRRVGIRHLGGRLRIGGTRGSSTIRVGATEVQRPPDGLSTVRGHESTHVTEGGVEGLT